MTLLPEEAVEGLAKFEFDRLERESELQVVGGPLPWEECELGVRKELLSWARDALAEPAVAIERQVREELARRADGLPPAIEAWVRTFPKPGQAAIKNLLLAAFNIQVEDVVRLRDTELREWARSFMAKKRGGPGPGFGCTNLDRVEAEGVKHFLDSIFEEGDDGR